MGNFVKLSLVNETSTEEGEVTYDGGAPSVPPAGAITPVPALSYDYNEHATSNVFYVDVVLRVRNARNELLAQSQPTRLQSQDGTFYLHHIDIELYVTSAGGSAYWEGTATLYRSLTFALKTQITIPLSAVPNTRGPHRPTKGPRDLKKTVHLAVKRPKADAAWVAKMLEHAAKRIS